MDETGLFNFERGKFIRNTAIITIMVFFVTVIHTYLDYGTLNFKNLIILFSYIFIVSLLLNLIYYTGNSLFNKFRK